MTDLDEFQLIRPLGQGGMGMVYLAHDTVLDRRVAIKLIGARDPDAASRERFLTEARAIARLSHPNVVSIFRVGTTKDGRPYLVQELVDGTSLDQLPRPLPWRRVCELALGVVRGIAAAHHRGILHRDIKPANVMLDAGSTVRILDFGLAKLTSAADATGAAVAREPSGDLDATLDPLRSRSPAEADTRDRSDAPASVQPRTTAGALVGTPRYLAPELWRGEPATVRSDLYALGVMLYELLTGTTPFVGGDLAELETAATTRDAPSVTAAAADVPTWLAHVIERCLARDAAARWESADELALALERGLAGAPSIPAGNPYRGLEPFDAGHRGVFFGRETDVATIVDKLRTESLIAITGDSGIGKSSLCRASIVPAIASGALDDRTWRTVVISPGRCPVATLEEALGIDPRAAIPPADRGLLVFVDQCEELITLADRTQAERAAEWLGALADGHPNVRVLLAVRGDFLTRIAALPGLATPLSRGLHLLRALSASDVREAIEGPARLKGVRFESSAMVDELASSVAKAPATLPLLQFALAELWSARDRDGDTLRASSLAQLGGVAGAFARHADRVILSLGARERRAARGLLLRLVSDEGTRTSRPASELVDGEIAASALESLVRGRLVLARDTAEAPTYELVHEAMIRGWGTLRDWLDAAAGQQTIRNRLLASAAEWHRLDRRPDLLWSRRQIEEARGITDATPRERDFVTASRRRNRRRRIARVAAIAALPLVAIAIWSALELAATRRRDRQVAERVHAATAHRQRADALAADAARARSLAFASFDRDANGDGERAWAEARQLGALAHAAYGDATAELEAANLIAPSAGRAEMVRVLTAHATLAEAERDRTRADELERRLAAHAPADSAPTARLVVELDRPGQIAVHALRTTPGPALPGGFDATPILARPGPRLDAELPAGSYVIVVALGDGSVVRDPIVLGHGEQLARHLSPPAEVPGFVYVPAGRFLFGAGGDEAVRREFFRAQPLHEVATDAYMIARTEVTFAEWMTYLRQLAGDERAARTPRTTSGGGTGAVRLDETDGRFTLVLQPTSTSYVAGEGIALAYSNRAVRKSVRWEQLPVSGISWEDALAYTAWLDRTGRLRGARPCTHREWERAARGADARAFPTGETLAPDQANIDATYGRDPLAYGPDEVGSFPASDSPFGVADLAGNATEWVRAPDGRPGLKGGSWYHGAITARAANFTAGEPTLRSVRVGLRVCASAEPAR